MDLACDLCMFCLIFNPMTLETLSSLWKVHYVFRLSQAMHTSTGSSLGQAKSSKSSWEFLWKYLLKCPSILSLSGIYCPHHDGFELISQYKLKGNDVEIQAVLNLVQPQGIPQFPQGVFSLVLAAFLSKPQKLPQHIIRTIYLKYTCMIKCVQSIFVHKINASDFL